MLVCRRNGFMSVDKGLTPRESSSGAGGDSGRTEVLRQAVPSGGGL